MSKFNVGDWIVYTRTKMPKAYKIIEVNAKYYKIKHGENELGYSRSLEEDLRLASNDEINNAIRLNRNIRDKLFHIDLFWPKLLLTIGVISLLWYNFSPFFEDSTQKCIGAICMDGWESSSTGRGTCSHHGGVSEWIYVQVPKQTGVFKKLVISIIVGYMAAFPVLGFLGFLKERFIK
jgi:hypothetical protein